MREREYEEQMRRSQVEKTRKERKAREAFKVGLWDILRSLLLMGYRQDLLQSLVDSGKIKARTKWKEIYPSFRDDERYLSMLGNPGSNPLELFWDAVDVLDQVLDKNIAIVEETIARYNSKNDGREDKIVIEGQEEIQGGEKSHSFDVGAETTEEEFRTVIKANANDATNALSEEDLHTIYLTVSLLRSSHALSSP